MDYFLAKSGHVEGSTEKSSGALWRTINLPILINEVIELTVCSSRFGWYGALGLF